MRDDRAMLTALVEAGRSDDPTQSLHLCMLGCEEEPPYGPTSHTGKMFLDLIVQAAEHEKLNIQIRISLYRVSLMDYPESFQEFDGILLPGSFSAAYDTDDWIVHLKQVIRDQLWPQRIPTMGVCFGHQILAHALEGGKASKCPLGVQVGVRVFPTISPDDKRLHRSSGDKNLYLMYTHGDFVESLPGMAISLGGTSDVPILGAIYNDQENHPIFCTFQAHPEYASEGPKQPTLRNSLVQMEQRGSIMNHEVYMEIVGRHWHEIYRDSLHVMVATCRMLKWFPVQGFEND